MIGRFFRWWGDELARLVPERLRSRPEQRLAHLELELTDSSIIASRVVGAKRKPLASVAPARAGKAADAESSGKLLSLLNRKLKPSKTRVSVALPSHRALRRTVELPLAAQENLHRVLSYELHRLTPFKSENVYFDARVIERVSGTKQMRVSLEVVPRAAVDEALELLDDWDDLRGDRLVRVEARDDRTRVSFFPPAPSSGWPALVSAALLVLNVALLGAVIAIPLARQERMLEELRTELARVQAAASRASEMRERLESIQSELDFLIRQKSSAPAMVEVVEELSRRLPDDTWLNRLDVKEGELRLAGFSAASAPLISLIEESEMLGDVRFISPVIRDPTTGHERFMLSARLASRETPE